MRLAVRPGIAGGGALTAGQVGRGSFMVANPANVLAVLPPNAGPLKSEAGPLIVPRDGVPSLQQRWMLTRFYLPVDVLTVNTSGQPQAGATDILITSMIDGETIWNNQIIITPTKNPNLVNTGGSGLINDQPFEPIELQAGNRIEFRYAVSFDEPVLAFNLGLCQVLTDPNNSIAAAQPGFIAITVDFDYEGR